MSEIEQLKFTILLFVILVVWTIIDKLHKTNILKKEMIDKLGDLHKSQQLTNQFLSKISQYLIQKEKKENEKEK